MIFFLTLSVKHLRHFLVMHPAKKIFFTLLLLNTLKLLLPQTRLLFRL